MAASWRNWGRNQVAHPARVERPDDAQGVADVVREAARAGRTVKAVGAGHSFTDIAVTDGVQLRLDGLARIRSVDRSTGLVTVDAGIPLYRLNAELEAQGLAMTNLGDIDRQTIAGAISTGTHGTGARYQGIAASVRALELVTGDGTLLRCSPSEHAEVFAAARVGLGALGVVTSVTLQCEPLFALHAQERSARLPAVLESFEDYAARNDHFEFYWFPHTDACQTKENNRLPAEAPRAPLSRTRFLVEDELLANAVFGLTCRAANSVPGLTRRINRVAGAALSDREYTDVSHRVFVSPRRVHFREMEYNVPRAELPGVVRELQSWVERSGERVSFPVEVRVLGADDIWLSPAYQRESAYVAVHKYWREDYDRYFRAVESIMSAVGGRPHWGKLHFLDAATLQQRYPRFDDFRRIRDQLDPQRRFDNRYLSRVLGE